MDSSHPRTSEHQEPVGELVKQASEQISRLLREELALAQAEMKQKGKRFGRGGGLFGGAGLIGIIALQALVATAVIALALVWPLWLSALVVTAVLFVVAGVLAALGRKEVGAATPMAPQQAVRGVQADIAQIKESAHR
ncbi:phage holin family protein [Streptomyces zhihengii]|uniref:Phage holin family protein n=1 Tax=Streptomyces zhihengii TaxID=1818004 RepID=A0ABS2UJH8_9ACTN|nr:phage holin family protein [Streptomyces zhihengii]MBM9617711.1 phage holin family protein [Streptomyces zhihengii]